MTESKRLKNELGVANNDYIQAVLNELVINVELKVLREKNTTLNESLTQLKKFLTGGTQIKRILFFNILISDFILLINS